MLRIRETRLTNRPDGCPVHVEGVIAFPVAGNAQGVKANVLFFDRKPAAEQPWTSRLWVYDLRTNQHFTLKQNPLRRRQLDEFVAAYLPGEDHTRRTESER